MKTIDGIKLEKVLRVAKELGLSIREGSSHRHLLLSEGMIPCPVATSTHVRRMVVPWVKKITGYDAETLYFYFKKGEISYRR